MFSKNGFFRNEKARETELIFKHQVFKELKLIKEGVFVHI